MTKSSILVTCLAVVLLSSCGGKSSHTEPLQVAEAVQSDVPDNMLSLLTLLDSLIPPAPLALSTAEAPRLIAVSEGPSCEAATVPEIGIPPTYVSRLLPFRVNGGVSGSCGLIADASTAGNVTSASLVLACEDLVVQETFDNGATQNADYNGQLGFQGTITDNGGGQRTLDFVASAKALKVTLGADDPCDVSMNLHVVAVAQGQNAEITEDGCVSACGKDFAVSGSETIP